MAPAIALAVATFAGLLLGTALFAGVQTSLRWTVYLLFVPLGFAALFLSRSSTFRALALLLPFLLLEDTVIAHRVLYGVRVSLSLPIALVILSSVALRDRALPRFGKYGTLWALLIGIAVLAVVPAWGSTDWPIELDRLMQLYVEGLLYFFLGLAIVRSGADGRRLLWILAGVGGVFAVLHFQFAVTGIPLLAQTPTDFDPLRQWRYGGPLANPNNLACYYAMFVPSALVVGFSARSRLLALLGFFSAVAMAGSLVLTASRGGLLSTSFTVVMVVALFRRRGRSGGVLFTIAVTASIVAYLLLATVFSDLFTQSVERYQERGFEDVRTVVWAHTLDIILENPFGLGLAYTHYVEALGSRAMGLYIASPHNIYLEIMTSIGLQGFLAIMLLVGSVFRGGFQALRSGISDRSAQVTLVALITAMIGFLAAGVTEPVFFNGPKLNHIFFVVAGAVVAMTRLYGPSTTPPPGRQPEPIDRSPGLTRPSPLGRDGVAATATPGRGA